MDERQRRDDFVVRIGPGPDGLTVQVTESPEGESPAVRFEPPFTDDELERLAHRFVEAAPAGGAVGDGRRNLVPLAPDEESWARTAGERLFRALLPGPLETIWERCGWAIERSEDTGSRLSLRVRFDLAEAVTGASLHRLPWELLYDPKRGRFLGLDDRRSVARYLEVARPASPAPAPRPLVVLAAGSDPGGGASPLDVRGELAHLERALGQVAELRRLESTTLEGLRRAVQDETIHVLHFMGHGELDPSTGEGLLILEDGSGRPTRVGSRELLQAIGGRLSATRLVLLNACQTAETTSAAPWAGLATALVRRGVGAVVAMTHPITDRAALEFSRAFYAHLARGGSIHAAVYEGRWAIHHLRSAEWAIPALFLRADGGPLVLAAPSAPGRRAWRGAVGAAGAAASIVSLAITLWLALEAGDAVPPAGGPTGGEETGDPAARSLHEAGAVHRLPFGEPVRLPGVGAVVAAEPVTVVEQEMVRLTVSSDEGGSAVRAVFPGDSADFPFPPPRTEGNSAEVPAEVLSIHVLSLDRAAHTVAVRALRRAAED